MASHSRSGHQEPSRRSRSSQRSQWYVGQDPTADEDPLEDRKANNSVQGTTDVRIDPQLNKKVWEAGIKGVPYRLRIRISRKRNDEESAKEKLYSYVQAVNVKDAKGLQTALVEDA
jgi:hypothetical protein